MLDNISKQLSKFKIKDYAEINNESRKTYNANSQKKYETAMLRYSLSD